MSLNTFRPVALIPAYNHYQVIDELLDALEALDLPSSMPAATIYAPARWTFLLHRIGRQVSCALRKTAARERR